MRNLTRVLSSIFILLVVLVTLAFVLENQQSISLVFLGWSSPQIPIAACVLLALLVGMVFGPLLALLFGRKATRRV